MKLGTGAIGAALISLTCMQTVQGQTTTLRYGQIPSTIKTVSALQFYVAQRKGFFARERVNLEMISIEGGAANMMVALDRGTVDITRTATFFLIQAALKGSEGVAIVGETATPIYSLMVKPEIKTFADLKGKVVGLTNAVSTIFVSMRKLLALHGLQPSDYRVIEFVGTPERSECLRKGGVRCGAVGTTRGFYPAQAGLPEARGFQRCRAKLSVHRKRGKTIVGRSKQRCPRPLHPWARFRLSIHARPRHAG
jgi:ABC-type nitrate/sulfonate/bicarbonate transport system substrate-binding protein